MLRYRIATTLVIVALGLQEVVAIGRTFTSEEGPYQINIHNISTCVKEKPWFRSNVTTYTSNGRRLLRGTFVSQRQLKNVKFLLQGHYIDGGKVKVFGIKNQDCRNFVVRIILQALNARYDERRCTMEPGTTEFTDLDVNEVGHSFVKSLFYGSGQVRFAIAVPTATVGCTDINFQILKMTELLYSSLAARSRKQPDLQYFFNGFYAEKSETGVIGEPIPDSPQGLNVS